MRYRLALALVGALAAAAIVLLVVKSPAPPSLAGGGGSASLLPADQRVAAPDFAGIDQWLNADPLTLQQLRGKVVLVDFWTFSCVNCVRTLPHLHALYDSYRARGLVVVGVHSPEFDFEKVRANVDAAVKRLNVTWPVALDSQMATWNAYGNQYWPAEYLIDQQGRLAYAHFGEGDYQATDSAIATLLGAPEMTAPAATAVPSDITPELYAGSGRGELSGGAAYGQPGQQVVYRDPGPPVDRDHIQFTGTWVNEVQYLQAAGTGHVRLVFHAHNLFVVAGTSSGALSIEVTLDGKPVGGVAGPSLSGSRLTVARQDLYQVLSGVGAGDHVIDLAVPAGLQLYTFTFG